VEEKLKNNLKDAINKKIDGYEKQKEQILKHSVSIDILSGLVSSLEEKLENLKTYSSDSLAKILSPYYSKELLGNMLDKLEITRLVLAMQDRGLSVEFNEEELNILIEFLESIRAVRDNEVKKFEAIAERDIKPLDAKINELSVIAEKVTLDEKGENIINRKEIDDIMQIVIEENSDDDLQIAILRGLNNVNVIIHAKTKI
jgi:hypothetical protein